MDQADDDAYVVGYGKPPKSSQFKKGECRNPNGRRGKKPKKAVKPESDGDILIRIDNETVEYNGTTITKLEAGLRILYAKAIKGETRAMQLIDKKREKAAMSALQARCGVLVIPQAPSLEEWEARTARDQAQYRERRPWAEEGEF